MHRYIEQEARFAGSERACAPPLSRDAGGLAGPVRSSSRLGFAHQVINKFFTDLSLEHDKELSDALAHALHPDRTASSTPTSTIGALDKTSEPRRSVTVTVSKFDAESFFASSSSEEDDDDDNDERDDTDTDDDASTDGELWRNVSVRDRPECSSPPPPALHGGGGMFAGRRHHDDNDDLDDEIESAIARHERETLAAARIQVCSFVLYSSWKSTHLNAPFLFFLKLLFALFSLF